MSALPEAEEWPEPEVHGSSLTGYYWTSPASGARFEATVDERRDLIYVYRTPPLKHSDFYSEFDNQCINTLASKIEDSEREREAAADGEVVMLGTGSARPCDTEAA